jgi:hypothetical protein
MSKSLKIFLAVLALISITASVFIIFEWGPFAKKEKEVAPQPIITEEQPAEQAPEDLVGYPELKEMPTEDKNALVRPVDEKYFKEALIDEKNPQSLFFFLEDGISIKSVFKGNVKVVLKNQEVFLENNDTYEIVIEREDGEYWATYLVFGNPTIVAGDIIEKNKEIAISKVHSDDLGSVTNLGLWIRNKDNELIKLSKEMLIKSNKLNNKWPK